MSSFNPKARDATHLFGIDLADGGGWVDHETYDGVFALVVGVLGIGKTA